MTKQRKSTLKLVPTQNPTIIVKLTNLVFYNLLLRLSHRGYVNQKDIDDSVLITRGVLLENKQSVMGKTSIK